jgi:hypothetical protein
VPDANGASGLPCGLQVVARDLPRLLAAAGWCERMLTVK